MDKPFAPGTRVEVIAPARGSGNQTFGFPAFFRIGDKGFVISYDAEDKDYLVQFDENSGADTAHKRRWYVGDDSLQLENPNA